MLNQALKQTFAWHENTMVRGYCIDIMGNHQKIECVTTYKHNTTISRSRSNQRLWWLALLLRESNVFLSSQLPLGTAVYTTVLTTRVQPYPHSLFSDTKFSSYHGNRNRRRFGERRGLWASNGCVTGTADALYPYEYMALYSPRYVSHNNFCQKTFTIHNTKFSTSVAGFLKL